MSVKYEYKRVKMSELLLDDENPRFSSSKLVKESSTKVSQEAIITHLLTYADIIKLAHRINKVTELHGAELITCYKREDGYVVLEGNRRTCACKLLLNRDLIPKAYKRNFPFINNETRENIEEIMVIVYPNRESVQAFLSDRHINGVKRWTALEKNNYYMDLFDEYKKLEKVQEHTSDNLATIKNSIRKYQFFMDVYNVIKTKYSDLEIEKINYLPMVDRFLDILVGNDEDVGLNLNLSPDTLRYECSEFKLKRYQDILFAVGEAFLARKDKKYCSDDELSKIISSEISNASDQKDLILSDERIPGLLELIKSFKDLCDSPSDDEGHESGDGDKGTAPSASGHYDPNGNNANGEDNDDSTGDDESDDSEDPGYTEAGKFIPPKRYKPKKNKKEYLDFFQEETTNWDINGDSDYEIKIHSLIYDLATISVYDHPYASAFLYRSLLEVVTRYTFIRKSPSIKQSYNESDLVGNMRYLNNNIIFANKHGKDIPKTKEAIKNNLSGSDIIQILNLYIHYDKPVDEQILLSTWNSMKFYIQACLEK